MICHTRTVFRGMKPLNNALNPLKNNHMVLKQVRVDAQDKRDLY